MTGGSRDGAVPTTPIEPPTSPWQRFYAGAHRLRQRYWQRRSVRLPRPVISLGNLHWGGTGKTPMTLSIARWLSERGQQVAILSRGYGRTGASPTLVSRGDGPIVDVSSAGDEPYLLAERLAGVYVVVAARRAEAGWLAMEQLDPPPDLFLLDDGFSHLSLQRDLDLLLFPSNDLLAGGRLLPSGRLREPLEASARADALLVTSFEGPDPVGCQLAQALRPCGFIGPGFDSVSRCRLLAEQPLQRQVVLVSAVARPETVATAAEALGLDVLDHLAFHDHHSYPDRTIAAIQDRCKALGTRTVATTAKDRVKLAERIELSLVVIDLEARPEEAFWQWFERRIDELLASAVGERP